MKRRRALLAFASAAAISILATAAPPVHAEDGFVDFLDTRQTHSDPLWRFLAEPASDTERLSTLGYGEFSRGDRPAEEYAANRNLNSDEMRMLIEREYGRGSWLTRTGVAMATVVGTVEKGTQIPLDGVNYVTDRASEKARETFRIDNMPEMRFHSRARGRRIGIVFQARW